MLLNLHMQTIVPHTKLCLEGWTAGQPDGRMAYGPYWALLGPIGSYRALLGHIGPNWALLGLLLGAIGPYWVLLGPIGSYWVLFGPIGSYWGRSLVSWGVFGLCILGSSSKLARRMDHVLDHAWTRDHDQKDGPAILVGQTQYKYGSSRVCFPSIQLWANSQWMVQLIPD